MNLDDLEKLKFDRRLEERRGWLQPGEREAHLEGLSDAADKIHDGSEGEAAEAPSEAAAPAEAPPAPAASPLAGAAPGDAGPTPDGGLGGSSL